ncbi:hypothetical protein PHMEG_0004737 [Phytophthora megakarya]|uniref:Uncharacterized protein n=1 Tax=Phytophthora megakarya TaxID=4795 RepID=A0A225WV66_9STRA|nr:hypothetical protein PHMEG_0004737 [Phytophthora megakarya]
MEELSFIRDLKAGRPSNFDINTRELMCAVYAALLWGASWAKATDDHDVHVLLRIDNTLAAVNAQPVFSTRITAIALEEARYHFYMSATHISGVENVMADAGSRIWGSKTKAREFTNLRDDWVQVTIPPNSRKLSQAWALLRAGALSGSSRIAYSRAWKQWVSLCQFMQYLPWLPRNATSESTARLGGIVVFLWKFGMNR